MPGSNKNIRLAVLMTCHNRVDNTKTCLEALKNQNLFDVLIDLILVDDGSTDGTAHAVRDIFPEATIITGDGNLYWCGGMRLAFSRAIQKDYDFHLWINDDTHLDNDALQRIFHTYMDASSKLGKAVIVVGSTREEGSGNMSYGGWRQRTGMRLSTSWDKIPPDMDTWISCDTMNGNCVFIPRNVVQKIGNLDINFTHGIGDLDYGLRAKKEGCQIVIAPGYYGDCAANDGTGLWSDFRLPLLVRWKKLLGPKGLPIKEWMVFSRRHRGRLWVLAWLHTYIRFWVEALLHSLGTKR